MNKIAALGTIVAALAAGCGNGSSSPKLNSVQPQAPVFADFQTSTADGKKVIAWDKREATKGDVLGIIPDTQTNRVLAKASQRPGVQDVIGTNAVISTYDQQRDLAAVDVSTGATRFETNTPDKDEWFAVPAGNGMVFGEIDRTTSQFGLRMADFATGKSTALPIPHPRAYLAFTDPEIAVIVGYGNGKQAAYTLNTKNGVFTTLFDLSTDPDSIGFTGPIKPDMVAYDTVNQEIKFRLAHGLISTYSPLQTNGFSHWVKDLSERNLQAIVEEVDQNTGQKTLKHVDLRSSQAVESNVDLSQTGINPDDIWTIGIGQNKVLLQGYNRTTGTSSIVFYDRNQNAVIDLLSQFGNVVDANATLTENGTALIVANISTANGTNTKLLHFNGYDVTDPFLSYDSIKPMNHSKDRTKCLVEGIRQSANGQVLRDLYHFDIETGKVTYVDSLGRGWFNSRSLSDDGKKVAYSTTDWSTGDNHLYFADMSAGGVVHLGQANSAFNALGFSADGKELFVKRSSGPKKTERISVPSNNRTYVCNTD